MLQRVQTIYMLASVIAILTMHFFWLASFATPAATYELNSMGLLCKTPGFEIDQMAWDLFIVLMLMFILPLVTIFLYKNRKLQLRLLIYTAILNALYYVLFFYDFNKYSDYIVSLAQDAAGTGIFAVDASTNIMMLAMPALSIFCLIMAMRGVIYDIALLKSLERLR